jgi:hypothetical protein
VTNNVKIVQLHDGATYGCLLKKFIRSFSHPIKRGSICFCFSSSSATSLMFLFYHKKENGSIHFNRIISVPVCQSKKAI